MGLFQQLCSLARLAAAHYETDSSLDIVGMSHLWKIALRASNTDVSLAAIQYINSYYMGQQLKLEKEFVAHCMNHLSQASADLNTYVYDYSKKYYFYYYYFFYIVSINKKMH